MHHQRGIIEGLSNIEISVVAIPDHPVIDVEMEEKALTGIAINHSTTA